MPLHLDIAEDMIRKQIAALESELTALAAQQREIQRRSQQLAQERDRWLATLQTEEFPTSRNGERGLSPAGAAG